MALEAIKELGTINGMASAYSGPGDYFGSCNYERPHQSLDYRVAAQVHPG
jgi:hypothetical protein